MITKELQEHLKKEALKNYVDSCPNYPDFVKRDLKFLVDTSKSPEELVQMILIYFSQLK